MADSSGGARSTAPRNPAVAGAGAGGDVVIRAMAPADLPAVTAVYAHYVQHTVVTFDEEVPTVDDLAAKAARATGAGLPFVVAEADGEVLGYAYAAPYRDRAAYRYTVEDSVYLAPHARGRGIGRRLLDAVLEGCEAAGARQVVAVIAVTDDPASPALHAAAGFEDAGELRAVGWKHDRWVGTRRMQRSVGPGSTSPPP